MKSLDVMSLQSGVEQMISKLKQQKEQMIHLETGVKNLVALDESFKGHGGQAIRNFYQDVHLPFLSFYQQLVDTYETTLNNLKSALHSLESNPNGVIKEDFLQNEVESGLQQVKDLVIELTDETNQTIQSVSDIVSLPKLDDSSLLEQVHVAKQDRDETIEQLYAFDQMQTTALDTVDQDVEMMKGYIQFISGLFISNSLSVNTYMPNRFYGPVIDNHLGVLDPYYRFATNPRVTANGVGSANTAVEGDMEWDVTPTLGLNFNQWKNQPINAATNLGVVTATAYGAAKKVDMARRGFGVTKSYYTTAQGQRRVHLQVSNPEVANVKKKNYRGANATNHPKLWKMVDPMASVKDSLKWGGNRLGYIGIGASVTGDIVHGVQSNKTGSEIAGDVTGTVAVGAASIVGSAYTGAKVGALAGTFGGPIGVAVGTVVGAGAGILVTTVLSDLKFMDVNGDGKKDSIGDAIKIGTTKLIDKVGSWFKK